MEFPLQMLNDRRTDYSQVSSQLVTIQRLKQSVGSTSTLSFRNQLQKSILVFELTDRALTNSAYPQK
jgi:hypothetical protein